MNCQELQGYIFDRVLGEDLPRPVAEELEGHLAACLRCRHLLEETSAAWRSLKALEKVRFPESISRRVLAAAGPRPRPLRLLGRPLPPGRLILAAASIVLAAGLLLLLSRHIPPAPAPQRLASTFSRSPFSGPDLATTLGGYLEESGAILAGIENRGYPTWGALLTEIVSRDIQGRSNFLLESPELDPRARLVVGGLHQAFWALLQRGRGREEEAVELPPGVHPSLLRGEIEYYQIAYPGQ